MADAQLLKTILGKELPNCEKYRITACNAAYIQDQFTVNAQIDRIPGGPSTVKGASVYAGPIIPGGMIFCEATIGPPMDDPTGRTFGLPLSLVASSNAIKIEGPTDILVVVVVTDADNAQAQCIMTQNMTIKPST